MQSELNDGTTDPVLGYMKEYFSPELMDEIKASLFLFDAFSYQAPYDNLVNILNSPEVEDSDILQMSFLSTLESGLEDLFTAHRLKITLETDLATKNQMLAVLYRLQHLEDPTPALKVLEGSQDAVTKLGKLMEIYGNIDMGTVLTAVESIDPGSLVILRDYLYQQEEALENQDISPTAIASTSLLLKNMSDFIVLFGKENIGTELMMNGVQPGHDFAIYFPFVDNMLENQDDMQFAKNILSFLFMARDTYAEPMKAYRALSEKLVGTADRIVKIELKLSGLIEELRNYQKAKNAARSVSVTQHPA